MYMYNPPWLSQVYREHVSVVIYMIPWIILSVPFMIITGVSRERDYMIVWFPAIISGI